MKYLILALTIYVLVTSLSYGIYEIKQKNIIRWDDGMCFGILSSYIYQCHHIHFKQINKIELYKSW